MLMTLITGIANFVADFVRTLIIDTLVGFCLRPIGL